MIIITITTTYEPYRQSRALFTDTAAFHVHLLPEQRFDLGHADIPPLSPRWTYYDGRPAKEPGSKKNHTQPIRI